MGLNEAIAAVNSALSWSRSRFTYTCLRDKAEIAKRDVHCRVHGARKPTFDVRIACIIGRLEDRRVVGSATAFLYAAAWHPCRPS